MSGSHWPVCLFSLYAMVTPDHHPRIKRHAISCSIPASKRKARQEIVRESGYKRGGRRPLASYSRSSLRSSGHQIQRHDQTLRPFSPTRQLAVPEDLPSSSLSTAFACFSFLFCIIAGVWFSHFLAICSDSTTSSRSKMMSLETLQFLLIIMRKFWHKSLPFSCLSIHTLLPIEKRGTDSCLTLTSSHAVEELSLFEEKDTSASDFCDHRPDGTYADTSSDCRKFFVCEKRHQYKFSCPTGSRFFQRFEECSTVGPDEEASFNCREMTDSAHIGSQSLHMDEAMKETHAYETIRRMDSAPNREKRVLTPETIETREQLADYLKAMISSDKSSAHSVADSDPLTHEHAFRKQRALSPCEAARQASQ